MTNCCFRVAGNSIFINFVHSSGEYSALLVATRHGGETLQETLDLHKQHKKYKENLTIKKKIKSLKRNL